MANISSAILRAECRACLKNDGILPIFGDQTKPDISIEMAMFGGIQLSENDEFPKFICEDCFKLLEAAISFRKCCKRSDALLKRRKKKHDILQENASIKTEQIKLEVEVLKAQTGQTCELSENFNSIEFVDEMVSTNDKVINFIDVNTTVPIQNKSYVKYDKALIQSTEEAFENFECNDEIDNSDESTKTTAFKKKKLTSFNCKYCNIKYKSLKEIEEHRSTVEHKRNYVMSFLPKKKKSKETSQSNSKDYVCVICDKSFTKIRFTRHMLTEHNIAIEPSKTPAKSECTVCHKMFHPAALKNHMKNIHGHEKEMKPKVKLECPICKKLFSKHFYPLHMQRHKQGDTKNFVCDQCGKKFFFKSSFFTHRLIHTNDLPHKCEYCPYRGRTKELLKIHVRTHTGDYPYKCTQCDTRCLTKSNLNSHMRRHRGPVDFICDACNRGFYSKIQLERHISVSHYGVKNHICSICGAAFGYRHGLMSHQRKVHKRPKGLGKPKAVYLQLEEKGLLQSEQEM